MTVNLPPPENQNLENWEPVEPETTTDTDKPDSSSRAQKRRDQVMEDGGIQDALKEQREILENDMGDALDRIEDMQKSDLTDSQIPHLNRPAGGGLNEFMAMDPIALLQVVMRKTMDETRLLSKAAHALKTMLSMEQLHISLTAAHLRYDAAMLRASKYFAEAGTSAMNAAVQHNTLNKMREMKNDKGAFRQISKEELKNAKNDKNNQINGVQENKKKDIDQLKEEKDNKIGELKNKGASKEEIKKVEKQFKEKINNVEQSANQKIGNIKSQYKERKKEINNKLESCLKGEENIVSEAKEQVHQVEAKASDKTKNLKKDAEEAKNAVREGPKSQEEKDTEIESIDNKLADDLKNVENERLQELEQIDSKKNEDINKLKRDLQGLAPEETTTQSQNPEENSKILLEENTPQNEEVSSQNQGDKAKITLEEVPSQQNQSGNETTSENKAPEVENPQANLESLQTEHNKQKDSIKDQKGKVQSAEDDLTMLEDTKWSVEKGLNQRGNYNAEDVKKAGETFTSREKDLSKLEDKTAALKGEFKSAKEDLSQAKNQLEKSKGILNELENKETKIKERDFKDPKEINRAKGELAKNRTELLGAQKNLAGLQTRKIRNDHEISKIKDKANENPEGPEAQKLNRLQQENNELQQDIGKAKGEVGELTTKVSESDKKLNDLNAKPTQEEYEQSLKANENGILTIKNQISDQESNVANKELGLTEKKEQYQNSKEELSNLKEEVRGLRNDFTMKQVAASEEDKDGYTTRGHEENLGDLNEKIGAKREELESKKAKLNADKGAFQENGQKIEDLKAKMQGPNLKGVKGDEETQNQETQNQETEEKDKDKKKDDGDFTGEQNHEWEILTANSRLLESQNAFVGKVLEGSFEMGAAESDYQASRLEAYAKNAAQTTDEMSKMVDELNKFYDDILRSLEGVQQHQQQLDSQIFSSMRG